ncbi:MAG: hypothetical protein IJX53_01720 [Clostridia bacterium]|nr:hypothetical protein [Clostridia bacterium]
MKKLLAACAAALVSLTALLPAAAADPRIVYEETFDTVTDFDQLGWEKIGTNATSYTIEDGKLLIDNLATGKDTYVVMVPDSLMRAVIADDYTVQYDLTYLDAGDAARYLAVLLNYDRAKGNTYNSLHIRIKGAGDWQTRRDGTWMTLDTGGVDGRQPIATSTASQTIAELAVGVPFDGKSYALKDQTFTVRQEIHVGEGIKIYVNDVFITGTTADGWQNFMSIADPTTGASEIALKAGSTIKGYLDNFVVAAGIGIPEPAPETTAAPETAAPAEEAPAETEAPTKMSDITVGAPVYAIAVLILATLAAVLVKRQGKRD